MDIGIRRELTEIDLRNIIFVSSEYFYPVRWSPIFLYVVTTRIFIANLYVHLVNFHSNLIPINEN